MAQNVFAWWEPSDEYVRFCRSQDSGITWGAPVDYDFYIDTSNVGAHVSGYALSTIWYQYCGDDGYIHFHSSIDDGITWQDYELAQILHGSGSQSCAHIGSDGVLRIVWFNNYDADYPDLSNRIYYGTGVLSGGDIAGFTPHLIKQLEIPATTEVSFDIIDGNDDVQNGMGTFSKTGLDLISGRTGGGVQKSYALRFQNINIPNNSIIWSAFLRYIASANQSGTTHRVRFWAEDVDNATQIADQADFNSRILTSAITGWNTAPAWVKDQSYNSPSLKGQVQEVVTRPGWASGNALQIFCIDNMSTAGALRQFYSLEGGTPARLTIIHSPTFDIFDVQPGSSGCDLCHSGDNVYAAWCTQSYGLPGPGKLYFSKSIDGGITWSEALKILDTDDLEPFTRCRNVRIRLDSEGRLIILIGLGFSISMWRLYVSDDDGATWEPHTIALNVGYTQGTLDLDGNDNIYVAYISTVDQRLYMQKSTDHGETFSDPVLVTGAFTYDWFHDVMIDSQNNIHVLTESGYPDRMYHHISSDGGLTFAGPHLIDDSETPYGTGARLFVSAARKGRVRFLWA